MKTIKFLTPIIAFVIAYGFVCESQTGEFFYNHNYQNTAFMVYKPEQMSNEQWTRDLQPQFNSYTDVITRDYEAFLSSLTNNFLQFYYNDMTILLPFWMGVLCLFGFIIFLVNNFPKERQFILFGVTYYVVILFTFYSERFSLPLLIFYFYFITNLINIRKERK